MASRSKEFLPTAEELVLKKTVFSHLGKLEDVNKKARTILDKYKVQIQAKAARTSVDMTNLSDSGSKNSHYTSQSKLETKFTEVTDKLEKIFILTLFTFHGERVSAADVLEKQATIKVLVGCSAFRQPEFYLADGETPAPVSVKRCMIGLTEWFKDRCERQS